MTWNKIISVVDLPTLYKYSRTLCRVAHPTTGVTRAPTYATVDRILLDVT